MTEPSAISPEGLAFFTHLLQSVAAHNYGKPVESIQVSLQPVDNQLQLTIDHRAAAVNTSLQTGYAINDLHEFLPHLARRSQNAVTTFTASPEVMAQAIAKLADNLDFLRAKLSPVDAAIADELLAAYAPEKAKKPNHYLETTHKKFLTEFRTVLEKLASDKGELTESGKPPAYYLKEELTDGPSPLANAPGYALTLSPSGIEKSVIYGMVIESLRPLLQKHQTEIHIGNHGSIHLIADKPATLLQAMQDIVKEHGAAPEKPLSRVIL